MISLSLHEIAQRLAATIIDPHHTLEAVSEQSNALMIQQVSTDSRETLAQGLFVALSGGQFDGHEFADKAIANGAVALVVNRPLSFEAVSDETALTALQKVPQLVVADTQRALGAIAALVREKTKLTAFALTGSNGKTTVKEMLATIWQAQVEHLCYTAGNFNNEIGVPLTLLRLTKADQVGIFELGANHAGEIDYTSALVCPDVALVNNVASAHLEGFGSEAGVAQAKSEIFNHLAADGTAVINLDDRYAEVMLNAAQAYHQLTYGIEQQADVMATDLQADALGRYRFRVHESSTGQSHLFKLPVMGKHQVYNALAATTMSLAKGLSLTEIAEALTEFKAVSGRMTPIDLGRIQLIDDSYNANPASVNAAIQWLQGLSGTRILVLGDLGELGADAAQLMADLGSNAKQAGIDQLFCLGQLSQASSQAFGSQHYSELAPLVEALVHCCQSVTDQVTVLVKGSRSAKMERVVAALQTASGHGELV